MVAKFRKEALCIFPVLLLLFVKSHCQPVEIRNAAELRLSLEKLKVLGSVLYLGAHPDDENTGLIAYLSKGRKYRTAYLSLTRGDGGQNLIGSEKGSEIGILRTQELLEARNIDGGEQYFTRAIDFGFSKSPEEALSIWGKDEVLADIVWVIRNFKPDIIITRFPVGANGGHGHHTASASLAREAFSAAADPERYPEQLRYVQPWQTKKLFWNNFRPSADEVKGLINLNTGEYNHLLGKSYTEMAAESRSMHKSQGFGVSASRGPRKEYFQFVEGDQSKDDIFDNINTSWSRIPGGEVIENEISKVLKSFDSDNPAGSLDQLVKMYADLNKLENSDWIKIKRKELLGIIQSCAGLWIEAIAADYSAAPGDEISIKTTIVNRSPNKFKIDKIEFPTVQTVTEVNSKLQDNEPLSTESKIKIPGSYPISQPYWLEEEPSKGLFTVKDQKKIGLAENPPSVPVRIYLSYEGEKLDYTVPLLYRWNDKVEGELYRPFEIRPAVTAGVEDKVSIFPGEKPKMLRIRLQSNTGTVAGEVRVETGGTWKVSPDAVPFSFKNKYDEQILTFRIEPPKDPGVAEAKIVLNINGKTYSKSLEEISHPHIKSQVYFPESEIKLVKLDIKKPEIRLAYIMGSGDEIPECLRNMGYDVTLLSDEMLDKADLSQFGAVIAGIRAYNTRERLKYDQPRLMDYVKNGGTLILQYNVPNGLQTDSLGPYPFKPGNDRITDEDAKLAFVNPAHQLLNYPNKITQQDFEGWIQERGLYFAGQWDNRYETVLYGHDPDEKDLYGGMLFTHYGKGTFIFTGFAWFRELPAGVPGAYRIFVNMISAGKYDGRLSN